MQPKKPKTQIGIKKGKVKGKASPSTPDQFFAKSLRSQETWNNVTRVVSKMRSEKKLSLQQASKELGVSSRTVTKLAGSALKKGKGGRYEVKKSDRLLRILKIPTADGQAEIGVRGSRRASTLGEYWAAVHKYLKKSDSSGLKKFQGKQIKDTTGKLFPLLTDLKELNRLGSADVLSFESLYPKSA